MKKILVGIGVFGVLLAIALGISALVICKPDFFYFLYFLFSALQDKNEDKAETPGKILKKGKKKYHYFFQKRRLKNTEHM